MQVYSNVNNIRVNPNENQGRLILYRIKENNLSFSTVNAVTGTGLSLLTLPMQQAFYRRPAKMYQSKCNVRHLKHIKREKSMVRKVIRSAASFPPQYNNERKCYPLDLIQFPLNSVEKFSPSPVEDGSGPGRRKTCRSQPESRAIAHISYAFL